MATTDGAGEVGSAERRQPPSPVIGDNQRATDSDAQDSPQTVFWSGTSPSIPERIGRYRIIRRLGVGGMGSVYLVENTELQREEALKVPHLEAGSDPAVRQRFLREARSAAILDHPNLCPVLDSGEVNGICFLTMRYLRGKPLSDYAGRALPPRKAVEIVAKLAEALDHAHSKGVIHRDLKPSNVMLCPGTGPTVMDFGVAKQILQPDQKLTQTGVMLGTPSYMPPEQIKGELHRIGPACDIYSMGVIFFELLTGRLPFEGSAGETIGKILFTEAPLPSQFIPGLSPVLDAHCQKAMAKEPENRYPSMKAFAGALQIILQSMPATVDGVIIPVAVPYQAEPTPPPAAIPVQQSDTESMPVGEKPPTAPVALRVDVVPSPSGMHPKTGHGDSPSTKTSDGRKGKKSIRGRRSTHSGKGHRAASSSGSGRVAWLVLALLLSAGLIAGGFWSFAGRRDRVGPKTENESAVKAPANDVAAAATPARPTRTAGENDNAALRNLFQMGRPHVVLVGIKDYADRQIRSRPLAEDDARAFYDLLTDPAYLGADKERVKLLLGSEDKERGSQPATRENILAALRWVSAHARSDDPVIMAFFVQGAMQGDKGHLLAADSTLADRDNKALFGKDIADALSRLHSHRVAVFLDVDFRCWPDSDGSVPAYSIDASPYAAFLGDDGSGEHRAKPGRALFVASDGRSSSPEMDRNSAFADTVLRGLRGEADREGEESDSLVTVLELYLYLGKHLPEQLMKYGKNDLQKAATQTCWVGRDYNFPLTINPVAAEATEKRMRLFDEVVKSQKIPPDLAREGRRLLLQVPHRKDQQELRIAYIGLAQGETDLADLQKKRAAILERLKLPADKAQPFADKVFEAIQKVENDHVYRFARRDLVGLAVRGLFESQEERIPDEINERLKQPIGLDEKSVKALLVEARQHLGSREELAGERDVDSALKYMLGKLDFQSSYINPKELAAAQSQYTSTFTGIGVQLKVDPTAQALRVITPIRGSPAYRAGIRAGDLITTIIRVVDDDGKELSPPEVISTKGQTIEQAIRYIKGKDGTKVRFTIVRIGNVQPIEIEVARGRVKADAVLGFSRKADDSWNYFIDDAEHIGYVRITSFTTESADELAAVMKELAKQNVRGLILDLRDNYGGMLISSTQVADLFIKDGIIATLKSRSGAENKYEGKVEGSLLDFPMACLVNRNTASGAEIVAAALQDHKRAELFGEQTNGTGSVQNLFDFHGGQIKLTTQLIYRPNGQTFHRPAIPGLDDTHIGVKPDHAIKLTPRDAEAVRDWFKKIDIIDPTRPAPVWPSSADVPLRSALAQLRKKLPAAR